MLLADLLLDLEHTCWTFFSFETWISSLAACSYDFFLDMHPAYVLTCCHDFGFQGHGGN